MQGSNAYPITDAFKGQYYRLGENGEKIGISRSEYKKGMRETFTVKRPVVPACGHKFVHESEPRHKNCESCWFTFFQVHGELTQAVDEVFSKFGEKGIRQLRGPKFTKNFLKFMSTIAQWKATADQAAKVQEENKTDDTKKCSSGTTGIGESIACGAD